MNEAGLVVSSMELRASVLPEPDERLPFGIADWVQYVLDICDEAVLDVLHYSSILWPRPHAATRPVGLRHQPLKPLYSLSLVLVEGY